MPTFMCMSPFLVKLGRNRAGVFFSALSYCPARTPPFSIPYREYPCPATTRLSSRPPRNDAPRSTYRPDAGRDGQASPP